MSILQRINDKYKEYEKEVGLLTVMEVIVSSKRDARFKVYTKRFKYVGLVTTLVTLKGTYAIRSDSGASYEEDFIKEISLYEDVQSMSIILDLLFEYENNLDAAYEAQLKLIHDFRTALERR